MIGIIRPLIAAAIGTALLRTPTPRAAEPETVHITLHARAGAEAELATVLEQHWAAVQRLKLNGPGPHLRLRGTEGDGRTYYVEIMTWRDGDAPDNAPAEVRAWWDRMNQLTEKWNGQPGVDIQEVSVLP